MFVIVTVIDENSIIQDFTRVVHLSHQNRILVLINIVDLTMQGERVGQQAVWTRVLCCHALRIP